jgi:hypothetical protein
MRCSGRVQRPALREFGEFARARGGHRRRRSPGQHARGREELGDVGADAARAGRLLGEQEGVATEPGVGVAEGGLVGTRGRAPEGAHAGDEGRIGGDARAARFAEQASGAPHASVIDGPRGAIGGRRHQVEGELLGTGQRERCVGRDQVELLNGRGVEGGHPGRSRGLGGGTRQRLRQEPPRGGTEQQREQGSEKGGSGVHERAADVQRGLKVCEPTREDRSRRAASERLGEQSPIHPAADSGERGRLYLLPADSGPWLLGQAASGV